MEKFSWSDNLRAALGPCLACLHTRKDDEDEDDERQQYNHHHATGNRGPDYVPRARPDELEGLLADSDDTDAMSLHSNIGREDRRKRKKRRAHRVITFFGFNLFGKPPIQLPEEDDDTPIARGARNISTSTLDSDASPLDPSTIDELSAARLAEGEAQREAERRAKEERRQRRREKKAARQAALALALENGDGEFEGFPGSGALYTPDALSSSGYTESDDFGPFAQAQSAPEDPADVEGADFGAEAYAARPRQGGSSGTGSDSRSRTSGTHSRTNSVQYDYFPAQPQPTSPTVSRRKKSSRQSISTGSQSNSLPSTPAHYATFPAVAPHERSPLAEEVIPADQPIITIDTPNGFPSVGFTGGIRRKNSEAGVFLANRGGE